MGGALTASTTHQQLSEEDQLANGVTSDMILFFLPILSKY
jgi:O-acetylhomoserine/O-acetylserine sulfhydrylase-like pyridoxal-dependent enzyme